MKSRVLLVLPAVLVLFLSACRAKETEPVSLTVEMNEYTFLPGTLDLKVGQEVTIHLVNTGLLSHEIMFGRQVMTMNNRPSGYEVDLFQEAGVDPQVSTGSVEHGEHGMGHAGFMMTLAKTGERATINFTVTEDMVGEWEIGCFEQEGIHYDAGMVGKLIVSK